MASGLISWKHLRQRIPKLATVEMCLTALTVMLIASFHGCAAEDRLLLNLYYIGIAASAYALVRRRALALTVFVLAVAFGTTLAQVYFQPKAERGDPLLDPLIDFTAWCVLLILGWRLAREAYILQSEEHQLRVRREIEDKTIAMRAAALTCTSHEVRTPLTGILSFTEMLLDESGGSLNELQKDFVTEIERCAQHLMALVNDILDYAKAQSGQIKLAVETVALPELVNQCVAMVQPRATRAEVKITAQIESNVREITADPLRLKQILLNLLSNAVKYSPAGGMVRIEVRETDTATLLSVRDTGRGMTDGQIEHLFDPYYQAATSDHGIGTGLGLAITKLLVDLHGGSITVDSAPGSGSRFSVRLPQSNLKHQPVPAKRAKTWAAATVADDSRSQEFCGAAG
jgi:signal transduction histidine kinase